MEKEFDEWISVFGEADAFKPDMVTVRNIKKSTGNIAGVAIPIYEGADFSRGDYDLYETPLWIDLAADRMEKALSLDLEAEVLDEQVRLLSKELRTTTQRVNLFEKVQKQKQILRKFLFILVMNRLLPLFAVKFQRKNFRLLLMLKRRLTNDRKNEKSLPCSS